MTPDQFRRIALSLDGVEEREHMGHPDFRVGGRIFATLGYPDDHFGTVMLSPEDQSILVRQYPKAFSPAAGAWGRSGSTSVQLRHAPARRPTCHRTSLGAARECREIRADALAQRGRGANASSAHRLTGG